jgi:hypothetical protein
MADAPKSNWGDIAAGLDLGELGNALNNIKSEDLKFFKELDDLESSFKATAPAGGNFSPDAPEVMKNGYDEGEKFSPAGLEEPSVSVGSIATGGSDSLIDDHYSQASPMTAQPPAAPSGQKAEATIAGIGSETMISSPEERAQDELLQAIQKLTEVIERMTATVQENSGRGGSETGKSNRRQVANSNAMKAAQLFFGNLGG